MLGTGCPLCGGVADEERTCRGGAQNASRDGGIVVAKGWGVDASAQSVAAGFAGNGEGDELSLATRSSDTGTCTGTGTQGRAEFLAFDCDRFRADCEAAVGKLVEYLEDTSVRGLELRDPEQLIRTARSLMTPERERVDAPQRERLDAILDLYIRTGIRVHSPGYMGRQFSGTVPLAAVVELASSVTNQPSSFYEAGQLPNAVEQIIAEEFDAFIGWDPGRSTMVTTSGGSLATLTALLAARNHRYPRVWTDGSVSWSATRRPALAVGEDVHYSVTRAAGILGIGEAGTVRLPVDERRRIRTAGARAAVLRARDRGLDVFCLVATAGTTAFGAFDPLDELADLAEELGMWLHVDGAHGGGLLVSDEHRSKLRGVDRADSLVVDAHKMLFVPAPCTLLFYRDAGNAGAAFRQRASYVFDDDADPYTRLDSGHKNFECTKRPMIMGLWVLWAMYGRALFAEKIDHLCRTAVTVHDVLLAEPDFEVLHRPEANILCFRYRPADLDDEDVHRFQVSIRNRLKQAGTFFVSKVDIDGVAALRVVVMNHRITTDHVRMLVDRIRAVGRELLSSEGLSGGEGTVV